MGVIKAQNDAKMFLACTLASAAASHCHILGYHREKLYQSDHTEVSQTKRQIYDGLYSPAGLQLEAGERRRHIDTLEGVLHHWRTDFEQIDGTCANYPQVFSLSRVHWNIMYYSTLTCLLRASATPSPGGEISAQCFQAARLSLKSHLDSFSRYTSSSILSDADFANWVLHTSSFTPFIVLFLHAVATSSVDDLDLLDEVVQTLRRTRQAGKPFERLYELCSTFARLARRMVEAAQPCVGDYNQGTDTLQLPGTTEQMPEHWLGSLQTLDGMPNEFSDESNVDVSTIFADWMNGQPSVTNMSDLNFGHI
ncbi:hypothetical protein CIB48_g10351 [Xylaria polymorpha]|nr:hypothetical protein CIB48_g10351 [Xylaria polymorpha]